MKNRYPAVGDEADHRCRELLREMAVSKEVMIYAGSINRNHAHLLISILPQLSIPRASQYLKEEEYSPAVFGIQGLRKQYWRQHLLARGVMGSFEWKDER